MSIFSFFSIIFLQGQENGSMLLRSEKIYAVLAVVLVVFISLVLFMLRTQINIQKMEKRLEDK
ncbi:MAG: CcmD family protein [Bacteroidota bacterium]